MSEHRPSDDFLLIARTDAAGVHSFADAVARGQQYREAGADMIFPEGLRTEEEFAEYAEACPGLLLANMTEFGKTPQISAARFESLGYDMVIYPLSMMRSCHGSCGPRVGPPARARIGGGVDGRNADPD